MGWEQTASGYAGVWATDNTREAIFDALMRKEVYATTGPADDRALLRRLRLQPELTRRPATRRRSATPRACRWAATSPPRRRARRRASSWRRSRTRSAPISTASRSSRAGRTADGALQEKVYDVVWSDAERASPDADGKLPPVGNTVDVPNATWTNTIGDPELITVWTDPDFDPSLRAFYYARVIEIPTPRWTAYDAKRFGVTMPKEVPMTTQERAYTSPIWYTPKG